MQTCGRFSLALKASSMLVVCRNGRVDDFEGDSAMKGLLDGFIDDTHSTSPNLSEDLKIT
jgi:hypothetical protein